MNKLFEGRDIVATSVRDWGLGFLGGDCPANWCAILLFDDKSDAFANGLAAVIVDKVFA